MSRPGLTASLVTCYPGPEVYELCGHEAIRIRGIDERGECVDSVWNYGVFDFNAPNFVYRFCKGETDYMVVGYPFAWFLPEYISRGSKVVEQDLNLTASETATLRQMLQRNALPQNRDYRYNYVLDNCSTRIVEMVDSASSADIIYPQETQFSTFRDAMRHYHDGYPWYQLGIDVALGSGIDLPITSKQEMFVPLKLEEKASSATFADGRPLVSVSRTLHEGAPGGSAALPPTPFWASPMAASLAVLIASGAVAAHDSLKATLTKWWYALFFLLLGVAGCISWFLVFLSSHYATSPNILSLWLSPLQLIIPGCIWARKTRPAATAMIWVNLLIVTLLLIIWPFQSQSTNPALFPMMAADLILCGSYIFRREGPNGNRSRSKTLKKRKKR